MFKKGQKQIHKEDNQNLLHIRFQNHTTPYFQIQIHDSDFSFFEHDFRINLSSSYCTPLFLSNYNLQFILELKTFGCYQNFQTDFSNLQKEEPHIINLLNSLLQLDTIQVQITNSLHKKLIQKEIQIPDSVKFDIECYLKDFIKSEDVPGLKESLLEISRNYLIPYTKFHSFILLCKIPNGLFQQLKFASSNDFHLSITQMDNTVYFSLQYLSNPIGLLKINESQIVDEIVDEMANLYLSKQIKFLISNHQANYCKTFTKTLTEHSLHIIDEFFLKRPECYVTFYSISDFFGTNHEEDTD